MAAPQTLPPWSELHPRKGFAADFLRMFGSTLTDTTGGAVRLIVVPEVVQTELGGQSVEEIRVLGYGIGAEIEPRTLLVDGDGTHWNLAKARRTTAGWWEYPMLCQETA